ncbi:MAG: DsbE family thiol:disulfide interchange protein [Rubricella sp.]
MTDETKPRRSPVIFAVPLVFLGLVAVFGWGLMYGSDELPSQLAEDRAFAPDLQLTPLGDLQNVDRAMLATGEVTIVNFWASWCAPCRIEHPILMDLADEGMPIIGVNYKDEDANALGFLRELGNPYTAVGQDESGRQGINWGLYGVPETYVIDGEGRVVLRFPGPVTESVLENRIRPAIEDARGM